MNRALFTTFLLLVALAPAPLGANREWSWSLLALGFALIGGLWCLRAALRPGRAAWPVGPGPVLLFVVVCAWAVLQTLPGTPDAWHHPLWAVAAGALEGAPAGAVSLAPDDGWTALLRWLIYGLVFFLAFQWARDRDRARLAFLWIAGAGLVYAVYGLLTTWTGSERLLWFWEMEHRPVVRATFPNRNHFATWIGLCLLCAVALFHQRVGLRRNPMYRLPGDRSQRFERFVVEVWKPLAVLIVLTAALIGTQSRGGFLAALAGGVTLLVALNHRRRIESRRSRLALASAVLAIVAAFWVTSEVLLDRLDRSELDVPHRLQAFELTAAGIEDSPALGFGYGTFADSFRLYRDERLRSHYRRAHNTFLENAFELGWPVALAQFACVAWLALVCLAGLRRRGRDWVYPATGLAATVLVAVHSTVDFSLQIPAVAVLYATILGVGVAQSYSTFGRT